MGIVSVFVIFLYIVITVAFLPLSRRAGALVPLISIVHLAAALFIIITSRGDYSNTDARLYYYDTQNYMLQSWNLGTAFVAKFTGILTDVLGGATFEDMMLFYSISGLLAVQLLLYGHLRLLKDAPLPLFVMPFYVLPGLHFWTSPIGKDGLSVLGLAIIAIFSNDTRKNWPLLLAGLVIVTVVRPHIGFLILFAWGLTEILNARARSNLIFIVPAVLVGIVIARVVFLALVNTDIFDPAAVLRFFSERTTFINGLNDTQVHYISNPVLRVLGFLLLPIADASSALAAAASLENLVLAAILLRLVWVTRSVNFLQNTHARFLLISFLGVMLLVGLGNWNVGLGLRQKTMLHPLFATLLLLAEMSARRRQQTAADIEAGGIGDQSPIAVSV